MKLQKSLFEYFDNREARERYGRLTHGGSATRGRRKLDRPLAKKKSIHLVLKSPRAIGRLSMRTARNKIFIQQLIYKKARQFGVRVCEFANVGNHLHLHIRISSRQGFQSFLRSISGRIARFVTGACRGKPFGQFWDGLAFSRVLTSVKEEIHLGIYMKANLIEARHSKQARDHFLKAMSRWSLRERALVCNLPLITVGALGELIV